MQIKNYNNRKALNIAKSRNGISEAINKHLNNVLNFYASQKIRDSMLLLSLLWMFILIFLKIQLYSLKGFSRMDKEQS